MLRLSVRVLVCVVLAASVVACTASVPPRIKRQLAPPDGTVPDHFRLRTQAAAPPVPDGGQAQGSAP